MPRDISQNTDRSFAKTNISLYRDTLERSGRYVTALENSLKAPLSHSMSNEIEEVTIAPQAKRAIPSIETLRASIKPRTVNVEALTVPLQVWEGRVQSVNRNLQTMEVFLSSRFGGYDAHTGEIDLQWVSDQDKELVIPGAVFYLTLFKRSKKGTVENSQELRFRRQPNWTKYQLKRISESADVLLAKMGTPRSL
jgi:hypothetical protein